jgi:hypothetical protein
MKEIIDVLTVFFNIFRNDILEYYQKTYSYLRNLIEYKKIDLNKKIETDNDNQVYITLENMLKAIKTGLNTIGIPIDRLNENQKSFLETFGKDRAVISDYNSYFEIYLTKYVNILLIDILIDYLLNIDEKKLENVNLFDLLPPYFISKLNEFKRSHFRKKSTIETFKQQNFRNYVNFETLTINKSKRIIEDNLLDQLREAKEGFLETLKTPKKEVLKQPIDDAIHNVKSEESISQIKFDSPGLQAEYEQNIIINTNTFLDYFGNSPSLNPEVFKTFKIDKLNLINLKEVNRDFFDLESLFYYISILKMLNLEIPFSYMEILEIMKNFINKWMFSSSKDDLPDSINNFYGLAIFSELDLLTKTNLIDLQEIENFIIRDLEGFIPGKLELNLYSLLCIKLITKMKKKKIERKLNLESLSDLNILNMKNSKPTLDIFNHLSSLKLLGKEEKINNLRISYANEIKNLIDLNNSVNNLLTESARAFLIFDLINLKETKSELCNNLFNYISTSTSFFSTKNIDTKFNWRNDILGFKLELEMLFWALLVSSAYKFKLS